MLVEKIRVDLKPLGQAIEVERGAALRDALFAWGVEFPCGGRGRCRRCRVRVLEGTLDPSAADRQLLSEAELRAGWRLACHAVASGPVTLEIAQMDAAILADDSAFAFTPREGLGIAVDLGTTTLVAQLLDLRTAHVLAVRTALNPQAAYGADIMSRVQYALAEGQGGLEGLIRARLGELVAEMAAGAPVAAVAIVGNAVMHHLFCGIDVEPLSHVPFESASNGLERFRASELGWKLAGDPPVNFLPCLGGFVGSDILAGMLAARIGESDALTGLIDLGTNGEILFGTRSRMVCASAAAGPAFEGGRISTGMRAATGAISEVAAVDGGFACRVVGNAEPRGICGSGLVDAAAAALDLGLILPGGRLANGRTPIPLAGAVALTQADIRELQLAKGAVAAGIRIVLNRLGASMEDVERVYLAGAFGNYVNRASARRIGLIGFPDSKIEQAGNTALLGAKLALFREDNEFADLRERVEHISLASDPEFQEIYVEEMGFPNPPKPGTVYSIPDFRHG
ncbi:MAG: ASKHA domain-containing protein [Acidobacteriota bacterium]